MTELHFDLKKALTWEHTGKMEGMFSLSTSCTNNAFCKAKQALEGCICSRCYAESRQKYRTNIGKKCRRNGDFLKNHILSDEDIRKTPLNCAYFRFEAFGDLETIVQVRNYFRICFLNPATHFALWTKNPFLIAEALTKGLTTVPHNLQIVFSSPMINQPVPYAAIHAIYPFVNKVFTVYDKAYAAGHKVRINCGGRQCIHCLRCYKSRTAHEVNELLR